MSSIRRALACVVLLTLTLAALGEDIETKLTRSAEYKHSSYVFEGKVKAIQFFDEEGKSATEGPRFGLTLTVDHIHKSKDKDKPAKGDEVSLRGRTTDKEMKKKYLVPKVKEVVIAYISRLEKDHYEVLEPIGFHIPGREKLKSKK